MARKLTHEEYLQKLQDKDIKVVPLEEYKGRNIKILHKCVCNNSWESTPGNILRNRLCGCGLTIWDYKSLKKEALKYTSKSEFRKNNNSAYRIAVKLKIQDEICIYDNGNILWTDALLQEEALKYTTKSEFRTINVNAHHAAQRKGVLNKICKHMKPSPRGKRETYIGRNTILYYIKINNIYKIGIAIHERYSKPEDTILKYRYPREAKKYNIEIIDYKIYKEGEYAYDNEQEILEMYKENKYIGEKFTYGGESEMYTRDIYQELVRYFK